MSIKISPRAGSRTATLAAIAVAAGLIVAGPASADTGSYYSSGSMTPTSTGTLGTGVGAKLTGAQMVTRALDWVSHKVTYNQGQSFSDAEVGGPYRTDCGGLVDMAWQLTSSPAVTNPSPGIDASTYSTKLTSWSQLQPGDALAVAGQHINLFAGWINQSAGTFNYIAEDNSSVLTGEYAASTSDSSIDGYAKSSYELLRSKNLAPAIPAGFNVTANAQQSGSTVNLTSTVTANGFINYLNYTITGPNGYNQTFRAGGGPTSPNTTGYAYSWSTAALAAGSYSVQPVANEIDNANHTYAAIGVTVGNSTGMARLAAGDFLGDGHIDIAGIDANNNLKLYTNDGTGHLADSGIYMLGNTGQWSGFKQITAGDFLGDGHIDIAGIDANNNLKLYTNDGTGHLADSGIYMLGNTGQWSGFKQITAGDFLGDGHIDIAGIDANNNLKLYTNDGTGHLADSGIYMLGNTGQWSGFKQITAGDFLGDGHIDIAGIDANNNLKLYTNDGTGHLADSGIYMLGNTGLWSGFRSVVAGDFLGDGHIDIAGIDANNNLKLYTNDGTGHLADSGIYMLGNTGQWSGFGS